jgi:hypothetical protein
MRRNEPFPQHRGLAVQTSNRQISFCRMLNLIHWIRTLIECDLVPVSQYPHQFEFLSLKDLSEHTHRARRYLHRHPPLHVESTLRST